MKRNLPPQQRLREIFQYDANDGSFRWLKKKPMGPHRGGVAGSRNSSGYYLLTVDGERHYAHRIAWRWFYGDDPATFIDHINGDKGDNRISNLRLCTMSENMRNAKKRKTNTSGVIGVWFDRRSGKWQAEILVNYKKTYIGSFSDLGDAASARREAEIKYHGEFSVNSVAA